MRFPTVNTLLIIFLLAFALVGTSVAAQPASRDDSQKN